MKHLIFLLIVLCSCTKQVDNSIVYYSVTPSQKEGKWQFNLILDKKVNINGLLELSIEFQTNVGKKSIIQKQIYLGIILNHPSTHITDIDTNIYTKILSVNTSIKDCNSNYTFIQR